MGNNICLNGSLIYITQYRSKFQAICGLSLIELAYSSWETSTPSYHLSPNFHYQRTKSCSWAAKMTQPSPTQCLVFCGASSFMRKILVKIIKYYIHVMYPQFGMLHEPNVSTATSYLVSDKFFFLINNSEIFIRTELQIVHKACTMKQE